MSVRNHLPRIIALVGFLSLLLLTPGKSSAFDAVVEPDFDPAQDYYCTFFGVGNPDSNDFANVSTMWAWACFDSSADLSDHTNLVTPTTIIYAPALADMSVVPADTFEYTSDSLDDGETTVGLEPIGAL